MNRYLSHGFDTGCKNKSTKRVEVIFYNLSEYRRVSLVQTCIYDVAEACASDRLSLSIELTAKRINEDIPFDKKVLAVSVKYIDALYYNYMF